MLRIGDTKSSKVIFTQEMVNTFAEFTGDNNIVHTNREAAQNMGYPTIIVQGMLVACAFERTLYSMLGDYSINTYREFTFIRPVFIDLEYDMVFRVSDIDVDGIGTVKCWLKDSNGKTCIKGVAKIINKEQFVLL